MAKKKFVPITGLDNLTEEQKQEYYRDACAHFGIPAELNLLEFMWLDSGDGGRNLVLYAKKGATDIMREREQIHVDEMKETIGDGFIMFTAKGHDHNGRTDIAVGAASTHGLVGKSLCDALMTAQTRATRRLTLQFVGGGLLDESEVKASITNASEIVTPLKNVVTQPTVQPNSNPGKDITEIPKEVLKAVEELTAGMVKGLNDTIEKAITPTSENVPVKKRRGRRRLSEVSLDEIDPIIVSANLPPAGSPGITPAQAAAQEVLAKVKPVPEFSEEELEIKRLEEKIASLKGKKTTAPESVKEESALPPPPVVGLPKKEQLQAFRDRLFEYTNDVLRKGNMKGSEGIGGVEYKVRAFIRVMFPKTLETKNLTVDQWETFLGYMDEMHEKLGPEGLVKLINEKIGVKE